MRIVAFAGPSLPPQARGAFAGVEWRPPAEAGDLLRLEGGPKLIVCLIDGYFDHRPAVRHKEILLLLAEGARIFGASSIGALRAAEMDGLGLIGTGAIYRAYRRGSISGDDEVALVHADAERAWRPLSVPLVDVRATLCRARRERRLSRRDARRLLEAASRIHYVDRSWGAISSECGLPHLPIVEQKRLDAEACVRAALASNGPVPPRPRLVRSAFLDALADEMGVDLDARCARLEASAR